MNENYLNAQACEFFHEFARYEYCLKRVRLTKEFRAATACWEKYATEVEDVFEYATDDVKAAISYFKQHPPRKQIIHDGELRWSDQLPDHRNDSELILLLICRVRNNLFHGGKFNGHWFDPERSEELIRHSLLILRACANFHPRVREAYKGCAA